MLLRKLVQDAMNRPVFFTNRLGEKIPSETIYSQYQSIKNYLGENFKSNQDKILIQLPKDYPSFLSMLACLELGLTYIPVKEDLPADRVRQIKEDSQFTFVISSSTLPELLSYQGGSAQQLETVDEEHGAYIIFTSGTTGRPKGVVIQRKALTNFFMFVGEEFSAINAKDRLLQVADFSFDQSVLDLGLFLTRSVEMYFSNFSGNIFKFAHEIESYEITTINTVPNNLMMFLSDMVIERTTYKSLAHLFIGGARFSEGLYHKCLKHFSTHVQITNLYGPTEATVYCHYKRLTFNPDLDCHQGVLSIGKVLPKTKALILNDGQICRPFEKGELYIGGVQLLKEYINSPEQTAKSLVNINGETYYKSGDLAYFNSENEFFIVGRADETIKYRGYRINLLDIDSYIMRLPYVEDALTIAVAHEETENQTISFLILKEIKTAKEIKKDLTQFLLDYQIPEKIIFKDAFPTNLSGKVCRKTLTENYLNQYKD